MKVIRKRWWYLLLLLGLTVVARTPVQAETHIAVVGATRQPQELATVELTEALLTQDDDIILIDRHEVDALLAEQDLSRSGAILEQHAIHIGMLLEASIFAVLEAVEEENAPWHASIFDARTGEMLANTILPSDVESHDLAQDFAETIRHGLGTYHIPREDRSPVAIMAIRNSDLGGVWDAWCMGIGRLLEHTILDTPGTTLLNRRHLEWVNRETDLQGIAAELMSSTLRLSLEARRGDERGSVRLVMQIEDGSGNVLIDKEIQKKEMDAAAIAQELTNAFRSWITGTDVDIPLSSDPLAEAKRYMADAEYFKAHLSSGAYQAALGAAEAALALAPLDNDIINRAIGVLLMLGNDNQPSDLHAIWRCIDISKQRHLRSIAKKETLQAYVPDRVYEMIQMLFTLQRRIQRDDLSAEDRERMMDAIEETRLQLEAWVFDTVMEYYYSRTAPAPFNTIRWNLMKLVSRMHWFTPESNVWKLITHGYPLLLEEYEDKPFEHQGTVRHNYRQLARLIVLANGQNHTSTLGFRIDTFPTQFKPTDEHRRSMRPLFEKMIQHPDPIVNAYGHIGMLALDRHLNGLSETELVDRVQQLQENFRQEILAPRRTPTQRYRNAIYGAKRDLIDLFIDDPEERAQWHEEMFAFMLENRHIDFWTAFGAIHPKEIRFRHYLAPNTGTYAGYHIEFFRHDIEDRPVEDYPLLLARAQQIVDLIEEGDFTGIGLHWYIESHGSFIRMVEDVIDNLYQARPDLRPEHELAWIRAEKLYPHSPNSEKIYAIAGVRDDALFAVARNKNNPMISQTLQIPLDGSAPRSWGKPFHHEMGKDTNSYDASFSGSGGVLFVDGSAFVHFPSHTDDPLFWSPESGYPAENITAVGEAHGSYVLALQGGYILGRRPVDNTWQLIASARRPQNDNVRLDGFEHNVKQIITDPERNRLLLVIQAHRRIDQAEAIDGVWAVDTETLAFTQILAIPRQIMRSALTADGKIMLHAWRGSDRTLRQHTHQGIVLFNPVTDKAWMPYALGNITGGMGPAVQHSSETRQYIRNITAGIHLANDTLWIGNQVLLPDSTVRLLPALPEHLQVSHRRRLTYLPIPSSKAAIAIQAFHRRSAPGKWNIYLLELETSAEQE